MKNSVSVFEKIVMTVIGFSFCTVVLVQIFVNNDVLDTIKANEEGTAVQYHESSVYVSEGHLTLSYTSGGDVIFMVNGEEVEFNGETQSISIDVFDGDVIEVQNFKDDIVFVRVVECSENTTNPKVGEEYKCERGINYLFKVELGKL